MENLPIFKTIWAAHKQFFNKLFNVHGFFNFILPAALIGFLASYFEMKFGLAQAKDESILGVLTFYIIFVISNVVMGFVVAVKWYRHLILNEELGLQTKGQRAIFKSYVSKFIWILALVILMIFPIGFILGTWTILNANGWVIPFWVEILIGTVVFVAFVKVLFVAMPMYLILPAAAVGIHLKIDEAFKASKGMHGRLLATNLLTILPVSLIIGALSMFFTFQLIGIEIMNMNSPEVSTYASFPTLFLLSLGSLWLIFVNATVLSIFYMHYIVPKLPLIEKERELSKKAASHKPSFTDKNQKE